jgi:hypothetical protein
MTPMTKIKEHDYEPILGLPAPLPAGEKILWQGAPNWQTLARRVMRVRLFAAYFTLLIVWGVVGGIADKATAYHVAVLALRLVALGGVAVGLLALYAWLAARTTVYTITTRRVVMRFGIALPMTIQIAYPMIDAAGLHTWSDETGDIALTLKQGQRIAYLLLWPHARPWKFTRAEPALRGVPHAADVAQILGRALAASASQPARSVSVRAAAQGGRSAPIPATA